MHRTYCMDYENLDVKASWQIWKLLKILYQELPGTKKIVLPHSDDHVGGSRHGTTWEDGVVIYVGVIAREFEVSARLSKLHSNAGGWSQ